jgi:hypothetical protein
MKIETHGGRTTVSASNTESFGMEYNAVAFDILSKGLYKDAVEAIIRELSTNAIDAHKQAGTQDKPFDVHLPNYANSAFYIRDYGTGLSQDQIEKIYVTFFNSTKRGDNDAIGCFGLGSKTPFAYTTQYTVESFYNGEHIVCLMYKDKGIPKYTIDKTTGSKEPNGLKITFDVKPVDFANFAQKAAKVYKYFDLKPKILGQKIFIDSPKYIESFDNCKIRSHDGNGMQVIMGNIAYPVSYDDSKLSDTVKRLMRCSIDIVVPIGTVSLIASREGIEYDRLTVSKLVGTINDFVTKVTTGFQAKIDSLPDDYEVRLKYSELISNSKYQDIINICCNNLTYKNRKVADIVRVTWVDIQSTDFTVRAFGKKNVKTNHVDSVYIGCTYLYLDTPGTITRANEYNAGKTKYLVEGDLQKFLDKMGMCDERHIVKTSTLPKIVRVKSPTPKVKTLDCMLYRPTSTYFGYCKNKAVLDDTKPFIYISTKTQLSDFNHMECYELREIVVANSGVFPDIYLFNKSIEKKVDLTHGEEYISWRNKKIAALELRFPNYDDTNTLGYQVQTETMKSIVQKYPTWKYKNVIDSILKGKSMNERNFATYMSRYHGKKVNATQVDEQIIKEYPLLRRAEFNPHLLTYVKLIDQGTFK